MLNTPASVADPAAAAPPGTARATAAPAETAGVSVFVMTRDEEVNIARCLESVRWCDDVVMLDSLSRDRTVGIARAFPNVRVFERRFDDFSGQRNHGLHRLGFRHPWVLVVDADEVVEPGLAAEVTRIARRGAAVAADVFLVRRKVFMDGRWVRRNISNDFWIARLMRPDKVRYEGAVHERLRFEGESGRLQAALEHHQFSKGVDDWLARRFRYARLEAEARVAGLHPRGRAGDLLSRDPLARRAALKALYARLPARWIVYLAYNLLFKLAFLGGRDSLRYILLEARSQRLAARRPGTGNLEDRANA
jgi:glycosyltransferase involved in cell wall biosynthesis